MSKSQREKGKRGEREAAQLLAGLYPEARRTISQARGAEDCDVSGTPWHCEVKRGGSPAKASPRRAIEQAERDTLGRPCLAMTRLDGEEWLVSMRWRDFARLVREGQQARGVAVQMAVESDREQP